MVDNNLRMIISNAHDNATLSASSAALPVTHTQNSGRAYAWRSAGTGQQVIEGTLAEAQALDALVLYRHNLTTAATARIEVLGGGGTLHDTGTLSLADLLPLDALRVSGDPWVGGEEQTLVAISPFWMPSVTATGYRITVSDSGNPDGYLQIGRIVAGATFSPTINPAYGLRLEWVETVDHRRTEGGSLRSIGGGLARRLEFNLAWMDEADRATLTTELIKRGQRGDVFVSVYPGQGGVKEVEHSMLARRVVNYATVHDFYANWQASLAFLEV